ncbi:MAG: hypothetical protein M1831_001156 [Alyxoria varia]|nr:MAG: hypothetical protein M1831_001156 [Alyxoria varia]
MSTPPPNPSLPSHPTQAAKPARQIFDPWNSSSTGHQRAENRLSSSTAWRDSRTLKLSAQFADRQHGGGKRVADTVGAGSEDFGRDGRKEGGGWERGAKGLRTGGQRSLWECRGVRGGKRKLTGALEVSKEGSELKAEKDYAAEDDDLEARFGSETTAFYELHTKARPYETQSEPVGPPSQAQFQYESVETDTNNTENDPNSDLEDTWTPASAQLTSIPSHQPHPTPKNPPQIFRNLTIYINGSTYPLISDHKLKHLLVQHGANLSIALGRRSVTHVILGSPNRREGSDKVSKDKNGAGGGLASSKLQKEIVTSLGRGANVKYVGAEWVLESLRRGARAPEWKFEVLRCAGERQKSVIGMFGKE